MTAPDKKLSHQSLRKTWMSAMFVMYKFLCNLSNTCEDIWLKTTIVHLLVTLVERSIDILWEPRKTVKCFHCIKGFSSAWFDSLVPGTFPIFQCSWYLQFQNTGWKQLTFGVQGVRVTQDSCNFPLICSVFTSLFSISSARSKPIHSMYEIYVQNIMAIHPKMDRDLMKNYKSLLRKNTLLYWLLFFNTLNKASISCLSKQLFKCFQKCLRCVVKYLCDLLSNGRRTY